MLKLDHRTYVMNLLFGCPLGCEAPNCPLHEVRQRPVHERFDYLHTLSPQQISNIVYYHESCFQENVAKLGRNSCQPQAQ